VRKHVLAGYKTGGFTVRDLAEDLGMSETAVGGLVTDETAAGSKRGRQTIFSTKIEDRLVVELIRCAQARNGLEPDALKRSAWVGEGEYARRYMKKGRHSQACEDLAPAQRF